MAKRKREENIEPNIKNLKKLKIGDKVTLEVENQDENQDENQGENQGKNQNENQDENQNQTEYKFENQAGNKNDHDIFPEVSQRVQHTEKDAKVTQTTRKTIKRSNRTKTTKKEPSEPPITIDLTKSPTKSTISHKLQFHQTTLNPETSEPPTQNLAKSTPIDKLSTKKLKPTKRVFRCRRCGAEGCSKNRKNCPGRGLKKKEWLVGWVVEHAPASAVNLQSVDTGWCF